MTIAQTRAAIAALPHMSARKVDGEWRVIVTAAAVSARYPTWSATRCASKVEAMAYYTTDDGDALDSAVAMSAVWEGKARKVA